MADLRSATGTMPQDTDKIEYKIESLKEDNYVTWKWLMTSVLKSKQMWNCVVSPDIKDAVKEQKAMALISSAMSTDNMLRVINCTSAYQIWTTLESMFENKTSSEKQMLLAKFHSYKITSVSEMGKSLGEIQSMGARLRALGVSIDTEVIISIILNALPKSFDNFKTTWNMTNADKQDINKLISWIMAEVSNHKHHDNQALVVRTKNNFRAGNSKRKGFVKANTKPPATTKSNAKNSCYHCGKTGHWAKDCYKKKNEEQASASRNNDDRKKKTFDRNVTFMATDFSDIDSNLWIADSGCTRHMTPNKNWISDYSDFAQAKSVTLGDNRKIKAVGSGRIYTTAGVLDEVFYVPELSTNLFSLMAATSRGLRVTCTSDKLVILDRGREVLRGRKESGLYLIKLDIEIENATAFKATTIDEWHQRFGHISRDVIRRMADKEVVDGLEIKKTSNETKPCEDCALAKCKRTKHPLKSQSRAVKAGASLHLDTIGPVKPTSLGGSNYVLLSKDEASGFRITKPLAGKSEIPNEVKLVISQAQAETGNQVLQITTDHGSEFVNANLGQHLRNLGVNHLFSAPYTPQQNGFVEREVRTIVEAARTMLLKSGLPKELWAEAIDAATYVINRVASKVNPDKTPFELWFGKKPNVKNLRVFGQRAVVLKPKTAIENKWDSRGETVRFVGYTSTFNTYRFYDKNNDQVFSSCDVIFLEDETQEDRVVIEVNELDEQNETIDNENKPAEKSAEESVDEDIYDEVSQDFNPAVVPNTNVLVRKSLIPKHLYIGDSPPQVVENKLRHKSQKAPDRANITTIEAEDDPKSYQEAMSRQDKDKWYQAMKEELASLAKNDVWTLVKRPQGNVVTNRWVLRIKRKPDGSIDRYRARLVARGFSQIFGVDYYETYSPVVNMVSVRMLLAYAAIEKLVITQFDVKTAFLYGDLDETIYMEQPEGFSIDDDKVCLLKKSLYGLKQAPRQWNIKFTSLLAELKLQESENDRCIFYCKAPLLIIAIYVDDGIILSRTEKQAQSTLEKLERSFDIHQVESSTFLGFQIYRGTDWSVLLHQSAYIQKILKQYKMNEAKAVDSPVVKGHRDQGALVNQSTPFREDVGSLMYATTTARIDIAYSVNRVSRKVEAPLESDWQDVKRIFRYLADKSDLGLHYSKEKNGGLVAYCDSDFAGDEESSKSTTGFVVMYGGAPIHWRSQKQPLVTLSSTEAELVSICSSVKDIVWIRRLAQELDIIDDSPTTLYCDNQSAIRLVKNEKSAQRTRHMSVRAAYSREQIENGEITVNHVKAEGQLADMLTKPTVASKFISNRNILMTSLKKLGLITLIILAMLTLCNTYVFERTKPIIWLPMNNFVETGVTEYDVDLTYLNPCSVIPIDAHNMVPQSTDTVVYGKLRSECEQLYEQSWMIKTNELLARTPHQEVQHNIQKRGVISDAAKVLGGLLFGSSVTNLIYTYFEISNRNKIERIEEQQVKIKGLIDDFNKNFNVTHEVEKGMLETLKSFDKSIREQNRQIKHLAKLLPQVTWLSSFIQSRILSRVADLKTIINEFTYGRVATLEMSDLLNITSLKEVDNYETLFEYVKPGHAPNNIRLKFWVTNKSKDTFVYKVSAFRHWDHLSSTNLTQQPSLMEYQGDNYLIYNKTSNCIKAIEEPAQRLISEECSDQDYVDPKLRVWRTLITTDRIYEHNNSTTVKKTARYNYVYCFPWNITIADGVHRCPPYVFRVPVSLAFTTQSYKYKSYRRKLNITVAESYAIDVVHSGHFEFDSETSNEVNMFDNIRALRVKLDEMIHERETSITITKHGTTWWFAICVITLLMIATVSLVTYNLKTSKKSSHRCKKVALEMKELISQYQDVKVNCETCNKCTSNQNQIMVGADKQQSKVEVGRDESITINLHRPLPNIPT